MAPVAKEFERIIHTARERKKNEALADKIFSRGRRQSAPANSKAAQPGGSLASRVGVKKNKATVAAQRRRATIPAGDVNGEWTHDLHSSVNRPNTSANVPLSSRITLPGAAGNGAPKKTAAQKKAGRLAAALDRMETDDSVRQQVNVVRNGKSQRPDAGMTIRGLAGPFAIMGQNFAPGTTAADVESAMTPVGGEMISCEIVKTQPFMIVEMVFASREGGERVIETFNNKTADGRILKVYAKPGGYKPSRDSPSGRQSSSTRDQVVDGSMGFPDNDLMDTENVPPSTRSNRLHYNNDGGKNNSLNKRGRGFQRGSSNNGR
ncbi:uncharacterized protein TRIVIDRAFT_52156 [Trichoderma virens Gv29-8]|uniref:RRM domain-containing protein n=1 Tax=Hypocrea virens (strain Gv29-8 / FGSC 10586) TaxID=413071 RepID=G9MWD5_HYPVG|nr:uncharacterized protein TRIVIDRAFT_52156 [Trichoderma virens Gv29-8]EHK21272.1 hypothetical protein TRIVIDRAFT_52156 [Trichoderma virens Gv29-8]UKZ52403.1 hypothetical protein TrVGV298_006179 [Trichoderma virens]